jgi:hypothetical protein
MWTDRKRYREKPAGKPVPYAGSRETLRAYLRTVNLLMLAESLERLRAHAQPH